MKRFIPLFLALVLLLTACGSSTPAPTETPKEEPQNATEPPVEEAEDDDEDGALFTVEDVISVFSIAIHTQFDEDHSKVYEENNVIVVSVWQDGLSSAALEAKKNKEALPAWNNMVDSCTNLEKQFNDILTQYKEYGFEGYNVLFAVMNDLNTQSMMLGITGDGNVVFDGVNRINKLS